MRESVPSPEQNPVGVEHGRWSFAAPPGIEGSVQSPEMMPVSSPFSMQASVPQRQIPISNSNQLRGTNEGALTMCSAAASETNGDLIQRFTDLHVGGNPNSV